MLFRDWRKSPALVVAVSGGPDSMALLWLLARWRKSLKAGPKLVAVTIDHGLRKESGAEARMVKAFAATLSIDHLTMRWRGPKPTTGLPAAARGARYALLAKAAHRAGASHILTAHTRDDQAETVLMRMSRGSGLAGLAGMARETRLGRVMVARPLLDVPKSRLLASLAKAGIAFADDPTNRDPQFTRPRWRMLVPQLAEEGLGPQVLARLAARLARANAALEAVCDRGEHDLAEWHDETSAYTVGLRAFGQLPAEIRLRLLQRLVDRVGHEGPAELGKSERLLARLDAAASARKSQPFAVTLAGAVIRLKRDRLWIAPAPLRRRKAGPGVP